MNISSHIDSASQRVREKLSALNLKETGISEYNQKYMGQYITNYPFYYGLYKQLFLIAVNELKLPIEKSVFVDYGGGCGILSLLAKEIGFQRVVYNDIYDVSLNDAKLISEAINIRIDNFVLGDINELVDAITQEQLKPNLICSFDVLEHIYNLEEWFSSLSKIGNSFSLVFMTSANSYNPFIRKRLMKVQRKAEYEETTEYWGMKKRDTRISFLLARKKIINDVLPNTDEESLNLLAKQTRGLNQKDIIKVIEEYKATSSISYTIKHPTNTCDPYTGNWSENLINIPSLKSLLNKLGFKTEVVGGLYSHSNNRKLNIAKDILNLIIRRNSKLSLYLSPVYILKAKL